MKGQEKKYDAICIGQIVQDILVTNIPEEALTSGISTYMADQLLMAGGGDAVNEAAALSRLGDTAALLGRVDRGDVGNMICGDLERCGVNQDLLIRPDDCRSMSVIVVVKPSGEHSFFLGPGENDSLQRKDIDLSVFTQARAVLAGSLYILGELDENGIVEIFKTAKESGAVTIADMTFDTKKLGPHHFDSLYPYVDYCMPSFEEASYVTGEKDPDAMADALLQRGAKHVLIKLGGEGCFFKDREKILYGSLQDYPCGYDRLWGQLCGRLYTLPSERASGGRMCGICQCSGSAELSGTGGASDCKIRRTGEKVYGRDGEGSFSPGVRQNFLKRMRRKSAEQTFGFVLYFYFTF